jgi:hypothetical protein
MAERLVQEVEATGRRLPSGHHQARTSFPEKFPDLPLIELHDLQKTAA